MSDKKLEFIRTELVGSVFKISLPSSICFNVDSSFSFTELQNNLFDLGFVKEIFGPDIDGSYSITCETSSVESVLIVFEKIHYTVNKLIRECEGN